MTSENAGDTPHIPDTDLSAIPEAGWLGRKTGKGFYDYE